MRRVSLDHRNSSSGPHLGDQFGAIPHLDACARVRNNSSSIVLSPRQSYFSPITSTFEHATGDAARRTPVRTAAPTRSTSPGGNVLYKEEGKFDILEVRPYRNTAHRLIVIRGVRSTSSAAVVEAALQPPHPSQAPARYDTASPVRGSVRSSTLTGQ
jgi:hypothetical protein